jgi:hypothetical protein
MDKDSVLNRIGRTTTRWEQFKDFMVGKKIPVSAKTGCYDYLEKDVNAFCKFKKIR